MKAVLFDLGIKKKNHHRQLRVFTSLREILTLESAYNSRILTHFIHFVFSLINYTIMPRSKQSLMCSWEIQFSLIEKVHSLESIMIVFTRKTYYCHWHVHYNKKGNYNWNGPKLVPWGTPILLIVHTFGMLRERTSTFPWAVRQYDVVDNLTTKLNTDQ